MNAVCPVTRYPPSTGIALRGGKNAPASAESALPKASCAPSSENQAPNISAPHDSCRFHPAALSIRETSSNTWNAVIGSASSPPNNLGFQRRYRPCSCMAWKTASGNRRSLSASAAQARSAGWICRTLWRSEGTVTVPVTDIETSCRATRVQPYAAAWLVVAQEIVIYFNQA